jgi:deoxyribose-phosphate aldolase
LLLPEPTCPVDRTMADERARALGTRSLKRTAKRAGLELVLGMIDLTTLEGSDSAGKVLGLCRKARCPDPRNPAGPSVAAVCVYPARVRDAKGALEGSAVKVASVATAFPSGLSALPVRLSDVRSALDAGADEIDMVIDRAAFLSGEHARVMDEIAEVKHACGPATLKVILETGELGSYDNVRRASELALHAGADFIKTSTGKLQPAATPGVVLVMLEAVRDFYYATGRRAGIKPAGGIRRAKQALHLLVMVKETLGDAWLVPELFRIGASTLLNDVLMQLQKERDGAYQALEYFSKE